MLAGFGYFRGHLKKLFCFVIFFDVLDLMCLLHVNIQIHFP